MKKKLIVLAIFLFSIVALIGVYEWAKPKLEQLILSQINQLSSGSPVKIEIGHIHLEILTTSAIADEIKITMNAPELQKITQTIYIGSARAHLDFLDLLAGQISFSSLRIDGGQLEINLDALTSGESTKSEKIDLKPFFQLLTKVPIYRLALSNTDILLKSKKQNQQFDLKNTNIFIRNLKQHLFVRADLQDISIKDLKQKFVLKLDTDLSIDRLNLTNLRFATNNSYITLKGNTLNLAEILVKPKIFLKYEFNVQNQDFNYLIDHYLKKNLSLGGDFATNGDLYYENKKVTSKFIFTGHQLSLNKMDLGDISFEGDVKDNVFKSADIRFAHKSGELNLKNAELTYFKNEETDKTELKFSSDLSSEQISVYKLLKHLDIVDIPVEALIRPKLHCEGEFKGKVSMDCTGVANIKDLFIGSDSFKEKDTILKLTEGELVGELHISSEDVSYKTKVKINDDTGTSDGVISYQEGFKINYATESLDFKNVANLANLKIKGVTRMKGSTEGTSKAATFKMEIGSKNTYFEEFLLGDLSSELSYKKGHLYFDNVVGNINKSTYETDLDIDFNKKIINVDSKVNNFEMSDLMKAIESRTQVPVDITGKLTAKVSVNGPFQLNELSYDIKGVAVKGELYGETYDSLDVDVSSISGEARTNSVQLKKKKSKVDLVGELHKNGEIKLDITGTNFHLEESDIVAHYFSDISGPVNFKANLSGPVLDIETKIKAETKNIYIGEQEFPPSKMQANFNKKFAEGSAEIFDNKVSVTHFKVPYSRGNTDFQLKMQVDKWDFLNLYTLMGDNQNLHDYDSEMTAQIDLTSEMGSYRDLTGSAVFQDLSIKRAQSTLKNFKPIDINLKNGQVKISNFKLVGENNSISIKDTNSNLSNLSLTLNADFNLKLIQFLTPFLDSLEGESHLSLALSGDIMSPNLLGNAEVLDGFVKIKNFPQPFEKIKAEMQFSKSRILISDINAIFAGGSIDGGGTISFEGHHDIVTQVNAKFNDITLNFPDRMQTNGSGDISFTGSWFPFTLGGVYRVQGGYITKDFGGDDANNVIKQSSYLPKNINADHASPIALNMQIVLEKPVQIKNTQVLGSATGNILVKGPLDNIILSGKVSAEKNTQLLFKDKTFEVSTANIEFNDPKEINPDLYIAARSRVKDYEINLLIQGTGKDPIVKFNSIPPLPQTDIISLLALGVLTPQRVVQPVTQNKEQDTNGSFELGTALVANNPLTKNLQDNLGVNLQFSSDYDDTRNIAVQKITLSRKLTERVSASATRATGNQNSTEFKLNYLLNDNISAIGSFEEKEAGASTSSDINSNVNYPIDEEHIFGIDLEYKKEFK